MQVTVSCFPERLSRSAVSKVAEPLRVRLDARLASVHKRGMSERVGAIAVRLHSTAAQYGCTARMCASRSLRSEKDEGGERDFAGALCAWAATRRGGLLRAGMCTIAVAGGACRQA